MRFNRTQPLARLLTAACLLTLASVAPAYAQADDAIRYEGVFTMQPNGNAEVKIVLTLPMMAYQKLRENVSNEHLLLRELAPHRGDAEVLNQRAEWDNAQRTVTFTLTVLGEGYNTGKRWEVEIPDGMEFSNANEAERTFYFNEFGKGPMGEMHGVSRLVVPAEAADFKWEPSRRVVSYTLPLPERTNPAKGTLVIVGVVLLLLGAASVLVSFRQPAPAEQPADSTETPTE